MSYQAVVRVAKNFLNRIGLIEVKKETAFRVIVLGLDAAGKTTILYKLFSNGSEIITTIPTIGFNVETVEINSSEFICWDVGGCDKIRPLWRHYIVGAHAFVFVVDSHDKDRIESVKSEMGTFLREEEALHFPLLIFANKQDLPNSLSSNDIIRLLELYKLTTREWFVQESVATTGEGLFEGLDWLHSHIVKQRHGADREAIAANRPHHRAESQYVQAAEIMRQQAEQAAREQIRNATTRSFLEREDEPEETFLLKLADYSLDVWDHYTHLRLAWILLSHFGYEEGCRRVESSIQEYILHSSRTDKKSFHKTMTRFWCYSIMIVILHQRNDSNHFGKGHNSQFKAFLAYSFHSLLAVQLWDKTFFRRFYSTERIFSNSVIAGDLPEKFPSWGDDCDFFIVC